MKKRIICILVVLAMALAMIPQVSFAEAGAVSPKTYKSGDTVDINDLNCGDFVENGVVITNRANGVMEVLYYDKPMKNVVSKNKDADAELKAGENYTVNTADGNKALDGETKLMVLSLDGYSDGLRKVEFVSATLFEDKYSLTVGGTAVTPQNASDILGDGTLSFDAESATLTMNNVNLETEGGQLIESYLPALHIVLVDGSENNLTFKAAAVYDDNPDAFYNRGYDGGCAIAVAFGDLTISGKGTLNFVMKDEGSEELVTCPLRGIVVAGGRKYDPVGNGTFYSGYGNIIISGGAVVNASQDYTASHLTSFMSYLIFPTTSLKVEDATLNLNGGQYSVFTADIYLKNAELVAKQLTESKDMEMELPFTGYTGIAGNLYIENSTLCVETYGTGLGFGSKPEMVLSVSGEKSVVDVRAGEFGLDMWNGCAFPSMTINVESCKSFIVAGKLGAYVSACPVRMNLKTPEGMMVGGNAAYYAAKNLKPLTFENYVGKTEEEQEHYPGGKNYYYKTYSFVDGAMAKTIAFGEGEGICNSEIPVTEVDFAGLNLGGVETGVVSVSAKEEGYLLTTYSTSIWSAPGGVAYLAYDAETGKVFRSEEEYLWKYDGGLYTTASGTDLYLVREEGAFAVTEEPTSATLTVMEHDHFYVYLNSRKHETHCTLCGSSVKEAHKYDSVTHYCACGAFDPNATKAELRSLLSELYDAAAEAVETVGDTEKV